MIYCPNCGKGIPDQSKFCTFCGSAIKSVNTNSGSDVQRDDIDRTKPIDDPARITTENDHDQYKNPNETYIDKDGNEHVRTTPVSHDHITPTPSNQDVTRSAHRIDEIRNEDVNRSSKQSFVTDHASTHKQHLTTHPKNEFYKNLGFWGAVLVLIGFFVPYIISDVSLFSVVTDVAPIDPIKFIFLLFPVSALILIIQAFAGYFSKGLVTIFKILPLLLVIITFISFSKNELMINATDGDLLSYFRYLGVGFYLTVIGSILMIFFNHHNSIR